MRDARSLHPSRWTLRARMLTALVTLLAVVCLVVGTVVTLALRHTLLERLDAQVVSATGRAFGDRAYQGPDGTRPDAATRGPRPELGFLLAPGQAVRTVGARIENGQVTAAGVLVEATPRPGVQNMTAAQQQALTGLPPDGDPQTRTIAGLGAYRLAARRSPDGDVVVAGLPAQAVTDTVTQLVVVEVLVAVAGLVAAGVVGTLIVRRSLAPLGRVAATARRVSTLPLAQGEVALHERVPQRDADPGTEVGQVAIALNRMLGHVDAALAARHASETRVRQFVADASHELRTPLASIRGYAEFAQMRAAGTLPPDAEGALVRVRSQTERMGDLVDDLLLLARLDSGRPLARDEVDLTRLLVDAVGDAHAAGRDHVWLLEVPDEPVVVPGDAARLQQVVGNLLANARAHTPPGTRVTTALTLPAGADAVLTVSDDGPGVPPALLPEVFERFARGDDSRTRGAGSTGLGLAIVAAVAEAHGGSVDVTSEPGATTFTVRLPLGRAGGARDGLTKPAQDGHTAATPAASTVDA